MMDGGEKDPRGFHDARSAGPRVAGCSTATCAPRTPYSSASAASGSASAAPTGHAARARSTRS